MAHYQLIDGLVDTPSKILMGDPMEDVRDESGAVLPFSWDMYCDDIHLPGGNVIAEAYSSNRRYYVTVESVRVTVT